MSDLMFPTTPGLTWDVTPTPTFSTVAQKSRSRQVTRISNDPFPLWEFELSYDFLRDYRTSGSPSTINPQGYTDLELLVGFYCSRLGSFDSFLMDPGVVTGRPKDSLAVGAPLGVGDGATTNFQLQRMYGGFVDEVQNPRGTVVVSANGVPVSASAWTLAGGGVVSFAAAPAAGVALTADFRWAFRVCFSEDTLSPKQFQYQLYELQSLKLVEDKL